MNLQTSARPSGDITYQMCGTDTGHCDCDLTTDELLAIELGSGIEINDNFYVLVDRKEDHCLCGHTMIALTVRPIR